MPLDQRGRRDVVEARGRAVRLQPSEVHGKVVAELSLGFWRYLAASRYLTSLWVPALHNASRMGFGMRGSEDVRSSCDFNGWRSCGTGQRTTSRFISVYCPMMLRMLSRSLGGCRLMVRNGFVRVSR